MPTSTLDGLYNVDKNIKREIKNQIGFHSIEYFVFCKKYSIPFTTRVKQRAHYIYINTGCSDDIKNYFDAEHVGKIDEQLGICSKHKVKLLN